MQVQVAVLVLLLADDSFLYRSFVTKQGAQGLSGCWALRVRKEESFTCDPKLLLG